MGNQTAGRDQRVLLFEPQIEALPREQLAALQLERLKKTLAHAYDKVPAYKHKFDAAGVMPGDLKGLADLASFPFTLKSELRDNYPFGYFAVPRNELLRLHASSGTTGQPTVVGYTRGDLDSWADLMARSLVSVGAKPGDIVHNAYGYGLFTGGLGAHYGAERLGCTVVPVSGGGTERQVRLMQDLKADILCATPSYALNIAEVATGMGVDIRSLPLRCGAFGAEPWSEGMRRDIEARLGIRAVDIYGLSEILGPGVACECYVAQNGLHGWEDHFLFEIVDQETMQPLPIGASGELVITTLTKEALPMIRYRTRDITQLTDEPCTCGRTHLRIMRVTGRSDDMLIIRGMNVFPSHIEELILRDKRFAPHYQIELFRDGNMDAMRVHVELVDSLGMADTAARDAASKDLITVIKNNTGISVAVGIEDPGGIARSEGKAKRIVDNRAK